MLAPEDLGGDVAPWDDALLPDSEAGPSVPRTATAHTDLGNAERFLEQHGEAFRFCDALGGYQAWTGTHWTRDEMRASQRAAQLTARSIYREVEEIASELATARDAEHRAHLEEILDATRAHAKRSEHTSRLEAMRREASAIPPITAAHSDFDAPHTDLLLVTPSGTVDLATGAIRPNRRGDLITRCTGVAYDPHATSPRFGAFLERVLPDPEVRAFMRRWAGYAATGVIREHVLPIWYGTGANGKSTLTEILRSVLGPYAMTLSGVFFEAQQHRQHETEIAQLRGVRLAIASETEKSATLAEARVKDLTGGESVRGRFMRCDHFSFRPSAKFVILTNHRPRIKSTDDGIRRRIVLVSFGVTIPPAERDLTLVATLVREEGPGILRWIVDGARELLAVGGRLNPPASILAATADYLAGEDTVARFLDEGPVTKSKALRVRPGNLLEAFRAWCAEAGEAPVDARELNARLGVHGYETTRSHGVRWVHGLGLAAKDSDRSVYAD